LKKTDEVRGYWGFTKFAYKPPWGCADDGVSTDE
jgi:hypothetical protein